MKILNGEEYVFAISLSSRPCHYSFFVHLMSFFSFFILIYSWQIRVNEIRTGNVCFSSVKAWLVDVLFLVTAALLFCGGKLIYCYGGALEIEKKKGNPSHFGQEHTEKTIIGGHRGLPFHSSQLTSLHL